MAAFDFPSSPQYLQEYTPDGTDLTYVWNGYAWVVKSGGTNLDDYLPLIGGNMKGDITFGPGGNASKLTLTNTTGAITAGSGEPLRFVSDKSTDQYKFANPSNTFNASVSSENLTASRTFKFPDEGGTFALAENFPANIKFLGGIDVTGTAPSSPSAGDIYINDTAGNAGASWTGLNEQFIALNQLVFYTALNDWVAGGVTDASQYVTIGTQQTVSGQKSFSSPVKIGGTLPAAPNTTLNTDGSGIFNVTNGNSVTLRLYRATDTANSGVLHIKSDVGDEDNEIQSVFYADGSLEIGGDISGNNPNTTLNADGSATFAAGVGFGTGLPTPSNGYPVLVTGNTSGTDNWGEIRISSANVTQPSISVNQWNGTAYVNTVGINSDGSATFDDSVQVGGDAVGGDARGTVIRSGDINLAKDDFNGNRTSVALVYDLSRSDPSIPSAMWTNDSSLFLGVTTLDANQLPDASNISLNQNGSATFAGVGTFDLAADRATSLRIQQAGSSVTYFRNDGVAVFSDILSIGEDLQTPSPGCNIEFNTNGSATFGGAVTIGGFDTASTSTTGVLIGSGGGTFQQVASGSDPVSPASSIYLGTSYKQKIRTDGGIEIGGTITNSNSSNPNIYLANDGSASFNGSVSVGGLSTDNQGTFIYNTYGIQVQADPSSPLNRCLQFRIEDDGAIGAQFSVGGVIELGGTLTGFPGATSESPNIQLDGRDGSGVFDAYLVTGDKTYTGAGAGGAYLSGHGNAGVNGGALFLYKSNDKGLENDQSSFCRFYSAADDATEKTEKIGFRGDGSATFAGRILSGASADVGVPYGIVQPGYVAGRNVAADQVFSGALVGGTETSRINGDGSAEFAGLKSQTSVAEGVALNVIRNSSTVTDDLTTFKSDVGGASSTVVTIKCDGSAVFESRVSGSVATIPDGAWDLSDSNYWITSADTIVNPSGSTPGQTGVIYSNNEINTWGSYFKFPGGDVPAVPPNSIVPYYVTAQNVINVGLPTEEFA